MPAALLEHLVVDGADAADHPLDVDVDAAVPRLVGRRVVGEERQGHRPGVVDHHIDAPNRSTAVATADCRSSRRVTSTASPIPVPPSPITAWAVAVRRVTVDVERNDDCSAGRRLPGQSAPEPAACTGDHHDLAVEVGLPGVPSEPRCAHPLPRSSVSGGAQSSTRTTDRTSAPVPPVGAGRRSARALRSPRRRRLPAQTLSLMFRDRRWCGVGGLCGPYRSRPAASRRVGGCHAGRRHHRPRRRRSRAPGARPGEQPVWAQLRRPDRWPWDPGGPCSRR